ncbi:MAG: hypothetical protein NWF00_00630 [Candidatus Bathyarchaeota archaeon]|nr:hypothetical protein [Candidatus Bathyarchaeota archaeon]
MTLNRQIRHELQVRKDRLFKVDTRAVIDELKLFFFFLRSKPLLNGLLEELRTNLPDFETTYNSMAAKQRIILPATEKERVRLCLSFLEHCMNSGKDDEPFQIAVGVGFYGNGSTHFFIEQFFMPFYEYLDQHIEDLSAVLYVIEKFKLRSQWFKRDQLFKLYNSDTSTGEAKLDKSLRGFLFDNGIEYPFSSPASDSGRADIVASLHTPDPVIIEVKVFDGTTRGRNHIRKGFRQINEYMTDYDKDIGYLVIFNVCDKKLRFSLNCTDKPHRIITSTKTVFIIDVDIYHDITPASQRPQLEIYEITEAQLLSMVDNTEIKHR